MRLDPSRLLLAFKSSLIREEVTRLIQNLRLELEDSFDNVRGRIANKDNQAPLRAGEGCVNHTDRRFWVRTQNARPIDDALYRDIEGALTSGGDLDWIGPVYQLETSDGRGGLLCPLPNVLVIKPSRQVDTGSAKAATTLASKLRELGLEEDSKKSRYLNSYRYFIIPDARERNAYELQSVLLTQERESISEARFENMPMLSDYCIVPSDPLFAQQWNMVQIQAGGPGTTGWDISTGAAGVVIAVLDTGCDRTHPDLNFASGINVGTLSGDGSPVAGGGHGTCCAGIVAGIFNNGAGVSGVAGNCRIMALARQNSTDVEAAVGINYAADNGARVLTMSFGRYAPGEGFGPTGWDFTIIDPAIVHAVNDMDCVLVAATGNEDTGTVNRYPARHPLVIAVGASDQADNRKSPTSPDGECWGGNFGPGISVAAPGVLIPTTDIRAAGGYNTNNGGPFAGPCVNYPSSGDAAGDYFSLFNGTSGATPHVAGLAGAIRSLYPALNATQVRDLIERTAQKVGVVGYGDVAGFLNGTRNAQMGYGRINMFRALDFADVLIADWAGDNGVEPSSPPGGDFWDFSDIVIRPTDDNVFNPGDVDQSHKVERGQTNYIYVRVRNNGPRDARNVSVDFRITPYVGLEFVYPADWITTDANHVSPTSITAPTNIPVGGSQIFKFTISGTQVESLWGWISSMSWHPCLLARVTADNDYAFTTSSLTSANLVIRRNNLAQRNLTVVDETAGTDGTFAFVAGHRRSIDRSMTLVVERGQLPRTAKLLLSLDDDGKAFPLVDFTPSPVLPSERNGKDGMEETAIVFMERTKVEMKFGHCRGVMTLEKGSRFECNELSTVGEVTVQGGQVIVREGKRVVEITEDRAVIRAQKQARQIYPLSLRVSIPANAQKGQNYTIRVSQQSEKGETVGGATVIYQVK